MGLFDGISGGNTGILGGLPDWLLNAQAGQGMPMNFADRYANVPPMQNGGIMADPGLQQVSPDAMQAWRQGVGNPAQNAPGMDRMPPMAQPASGQAPPGMPTPQPPQGGQMPSALNGMPIPQMPSLPSFMGSAQAQTAPGIGDRLGAAGAGFFNAGSPMEAIGNLIGGAVTGQRQDSQGYNRIQTQQAQQAAYQAVKSAGGTEGQALAAASSPEVFKALAPELFGAPKVVKVGSNPITGDEYLLEKGGKFSEIPRPGGGGGTSGISGGNGMLAPGVQKYNPSLSGDAYMAQFSPELQAAAKSWLNGDVMPTGNPRLQGLAAAAKTVAQTYAASIGQPQLATDASYAGKRQMVAGLNQGTPGSLGGQITFAGTSLAHLAETAKKIEDLKNSNGLGIAPLAALINNTRQLTTEQAGKANAVQGAAQHYGQEVTKFYSGSPGGEAERARFMKSLSTAKSPTELADALQTERDLIPGRLDQLENHIRTDLGADSADGKKALSRIEEAKKSIPAIDASIARLRGEKSAPAESKPSDVPTRQLNGKSYYKQNGKWFEGNPPGDTSIPANANFTEGQLPEDSPIRMAMMDNPRGPRPKPQLADQFGGGGGTATSPPGAPALSRAEINKKAFTATDQLRRSLGVTASTPGGRATDEALKAIEEALKLHTEIKPF